MPAILRIVEENGTTITISSVPDKLGVVFVSLTGTDFSASIAISDRPALPDERRIREFLADAASLQAGKTDCWLEESEDLRIETELTSEGLVLLGIDMASNSDDECNWIVHATLRVSACSLRQSVDPASGVA